MRRKIVLTIVAMMLINFARPAGVMAQTENNDMEQHGTIFFAPPAATDVMAQTEKKHSSGGLEIACNGWKKARMIDIAITGDWLYLAFSPTWGEKNDYIKKNSGFRVGGGVHNRVYVTDGLYFDGRVGLHYEFNKIGIKGDSDIENHDGVFTFRPCIGFILYQEISIFMAYEGCITFKNGYGNSWSAGICFGWNK